MCEENEEPERDIEEEDMTQKKLIITDTVHEAVLHLNAHVEGVLIQWMENKFFGENGPFKLKKGLAVMAPFGKNGDELPSTIKPEIYISNNNLALIGEAAAEDDKTGSINYSESHAMVAGIFPKDPKRYIAQKIMCQIFPCFLDARKPILNTPPPEIHAFYACTKNHNRNLINVLDALVSNGVLGPYPPKPENATSACIYLKGEESGVYIYEIVFAEKPMGKIVEKQLKNTQVSAECKNVLRACITEKRKRLGGQKIWVDLIKLMTKLTGPTLPANTEIDAEHRQLQELIGQANSRVNDLTAKKNQAVDPDEKKRLEALIKRPERLVNLARKVANGEELEKKDKTWLESLAKRYSNLI